MGIQFVAAPTAAPTAILPRFSHRRLFRRIIDGTNSFPSTHSAAAATSAATSATITSATVTAATDSFALRNSPKIEGELFSYNKE